MFARPTVSMLVAVALASPLATAPAAADDGVRLHFSIGHDPAHGRAGHDRHDNKRHGVGHERGVWHGEGRDRGRIGHGGHDRHGHHDCREVSKHSYHDGRLAKIVGTLCYDDHGRPYIVEGSGHVVEYYE